MLDAHTLTEGTVVGGDYRVLRPLAEGGMGRVYLVEQISTHKQRALKVLHPALTRDPKMRERFVREAIVGARIESDHVVEVLGAGVDDDTGTPWLAMEYLQGSDLGAIGAERGALPKAEVREISAQLCHALAAAHRVGVVHRDLKPENVFVARTRRSDVPFTVKLLDFGIARFVQDAGPVRGGDATAPLATTSAVGSPLWMAPEQLNLQPVSPATDLWALGLLVFWALTGRNYWRSARTEGATIEAVLAEKLFAPLEPASVRAAEFGVGDAIPEGFDAWFARCVVRDPSARFHDAGEAHRALAAVLGPPDTSLPSVPLPATHADGRVAAPSTASLSNVELSGPRPRASRWTAAMAAVAVVGAAATAVAWRVRPVVSSSLHALHAPPPPHLEPIAAVSVPPRVAPPPPPVSPATPVVAVAASHEASRAPHPVVPRPGADLVPSDVRADGLAAMRRSLDGFEDRAEAAEREAEGLASTSPSDAAALRAQAAQSHRSADNAVAAYERQADAATDPAYGAFFHDLAQEGRSLLRARRSPHAP